MKAGDHLRGFWLICLALLLAATIALPFYPEQWGTRNPQHLPAAAYWGAYAALVGVAAYCFTERWFRK